MKEPVKPTAKRVAQRMVRKMALRVNDLLAEEPNALYWEEC